MTPEQQAEREGKMDKRMITARGRDDIRAGRRLWRAPHKADCTWMLGVAGKTDVEFVEMDKADIPRDHPVCGTCGS